MLQHLGTLQARLQVCAAAQDAGRGLRVGFEVPRALFGRTAKDAVTLAGNDVRDALRILSLQHETHYAGVAHAHYLTPDRFHGTVVYQIPGSQTDAVDDDSRIYLVE